MAVLPVGFGSSGSTAYQIANSLRFDGVDDYLSRTFGTCSTDGRKKWTWSGWLKVGSLGVNYRGLFRCGTSYIGIGNVGYSDQIWLNNQGVWSAHSEAFFRDPTAHCHVVMAFDTTQATGADRFRIYINGVQNTVTVDGGTWPTQNSDGPWNAASSHEIGHSTVAYYSGYLSDIYFIDGQALTPSSFGELDSNGVWVPKAYTGSYGNNGFHLDFSDGTSTTTLGYDAAGSNDWTLSGMTRVAGVNECWMVDTPTDNFATLNPLDTSSSLTISEGALKGLVSLGASHCVRATIAIPASGKWYWECTNVTLTDSTHAIQAGICTAAASLTAMQAAGQYGVYASSVGIYCNNGSTSGSLGTIAASAVLQVAVDVDAGKLWIGKNNAWWDASSGTTGNPGTGANPTFTVASAGMLPHLGLYQDSAHLNFGQRAFSYTPPTGFLPLSTANRTYSAPTTSGSFTGNSSADGPYVWLNGNPESMTINGNAVTWGTHADKTAGGFKVRNSTSSYNASGSNTFSVTSSGKPFGDSTHAPNTAKGNQ